MKHLLFQLYHWKLDFLTFHPFSSLLIKNIWYEHNAKNTTICIKAKILLSMSNITYFKHINNYISSSLHLKWSNTVEISVKKYTSRNDRYWTWSQHDIELLNMIECKVLRLNAAFSALLQLSFVNALLSQTYIHKSSHTVARIINHHQVKIRQYHMSHTAQRNKNEMLTLCVY